MWDGLWGRRISTFFPLRWRFDADGKEWVGMIFWGLSMDELMNGDLPFGMWKFGDGIE